MLAATINIAGSERLDVGAPTGYAYGGAGADVQAVGEDLQPWDALRTALGGVAGACAADDGLKTSFAGVPSGLMAGWGVSNVRLMESRVQWLNNPCGARSRGGKADAAVGMQLVDRYWVAL